MSLFGSVIFLGMLLLLFGNNFRNVEWNRNGFVLVVLFFLNFLKYIIGGLMEMGLDKIEKIRRNVNEDDKNELNGIGIDLEDFIKLIVLVFECYSGV